MLSTSYQDVILRSPHEALEGKENHKKITNLQMNNKNTQKNKFLIPDFIKNLAQKALQSPQQILPIIGISLLLLLGVMFAKVQPEYLKASFFGRFFPKVETPASTDTNAEDNKDQNSEENTLGFYRFNEIQEKYFPIPDTKNISVAVNYDYTPATFSQAQQAFIGQFETSIDTMITSSAHISEFDEQFQRIQNSMTNIHTDLQPEVQDLLIKICNNQDADGPDCE